MGRDLDSLGSEVVEFDKSLRRIRVNNEQRADLMRNAFSLVGSTRHYLMALSVVLREGFMGNEAYREIQQYVFEATLQEATSAIPFSPGSPSFGYSSFI